MRPSTGLVLVISGYVVVYSLLALRISQGRGAHDAELHMQQSAVARFGLTDLALSTEARYTRHPAVSDQLAVIMDHPGAIDHFPSTMFWAPLP